MGRRICYRASGWVALVVVGALLFAGCSGVRGGPGETDGVSGVGGPWGGGSSSAGPGQVSLQPIRDPSGRSVGAMPGPTPAASPPGASVVRLGPEANGGATTLRVGQQLLVTLGASWTAPRAQTPASDLGATLQPLRTDTAVGFPGSGPATASFTAVRVGQAVVTAHTGAGTQGSFEVSVLVQPVSGRGAGPLPVTPPP